MSGKNWTLTLNNYSDADMLEIEQMVGTNGIRYAGFEEETAPDTGTRHLQGFVVFDELRSLRYIKGLGGCWARMHLEKMRGRVEQNMNYCSKDGNFRGWGELPMSSKEKGKFGVLAPDIWKDITNDIKSGCSYKDIVEKYPKIHGMYPRGIREKYDLLCPVPVYDIKKKYEKLHEWQLNLLAIVEAEPDPRAVIWVWSSIGKLGKSDMVKHLTSTKGFDALQNGSSRDIACAWSGGHVIFDYSRSQQDSGLINYDVIEHLKNGLLFSPKYSSAMKHSTNWKPLHVICMSNAPPNLAKLSMDRWNVYEIKENGTWEKMMM